MMKRLFIIGLASLVLAACSTRSGYLTGVQGRPVFYPEIPLGMVYIHSGSYTMGQNDDDVPFLNKTNPKTVSVQAFYMDQTEITNNEYRQFVYWVRDSIAKRKIYLNIENDDDASRYISYKDKYYDAGIMEWVEFDPSNRYQNIENFSLNWDIRVDYNDPEVVPLLSDMYYPQVERYYNRKEIDTRKLNYKYYWIDLKLAAQRGKIYIIPNGYDSQGRKLNKDHRTLRTPKDDFTGDPTGQDLQLGVPDKLGGITAIRGHANRQRFIIGETINVYPDTLCWVRDFTYSFNDPMTNMYFWHPAYDNYPVVGVTWKQAKAFNVWRTQLLNSWLIAQGQSHVNDFRLPTEAEWEYAARGGVDLAQFPWGGPYIRNAHGCFLGNFKPMRGRYFEDGGFHTVAAYSYNPNNFGLYCMSGNVAEWCMTAYDESMYEFSHDLNTNYRYHAKDWDPPAMKRKVIRGGSWKDVAYYLQCATRTYEYADTAKSYIGFRSVQTHLGRGGRDFSKEGGTNVKPDIQLR